LGNLPEKENNEVDVLTGAYMMVKKEVLEKTGGFDEQFLCMGKTLISVTGLSRLAIKTITWQAAVSYILKEKALKKISLIQNFL